MSTLNDTLMKGIFRNLYVFIHNSNLIYGPCYIIFILFFWNSIFLIVWVLGLLNVYYTPELGVGVAFIAAAVFTTPIYLKTRSPEDVMEILDNPKYKNWKYKLLTVLFMIGWIPLMISLNWLTDIVKLIF